MTNLILYTTEAGKSQIQLRADLGMVCLSQLKMAELFQTSKQKIAKHLKAIFVEHELAQDAVVNQQLTTAADGKNCLEAHYKHMQDEADLKALENTNKNRPKT